jgi:hypothetical protein
MNHSKLRTTIGASILICLLSLPAAAQDWGIVLNGKSIHVDSEKDWNESNWGLGIEREFNREARWVKVAMGNSFIDSGNEMSYMAGGGIKRRFRPSQRFSDLYLDVGAIGFLMSRKDVGSRKPFPGVLPALTLGSRNVALNVTYLPKAWAHMATNIGRVDPSVDGILFVQLKLDASLFGARRNGGGGVFAATE